MADEISKLAAASEQNTAIADELIRCASDLKETVGEFNLKNQM